MHLMATIIAPREKVHEHCVVDTAQVPESLTAEQDK